ncbi:Inherit from COG: amino acid [Seminavis robusta]|uniref:Inherit from COG: amino acid n=1 Tax=Seminavis robusta TaxID=568900 RepID=A0A9N8EDR8_9STRA|nr:Inherit from COG: amino acid [Seminavis robusta]|eukprot:Sro848_g210440.1 Inherit from COG: amino acid (729) ;mRNA; r:21261-23676
MASTMKKVPSNPALYQQLDESSWLWTPPGAHRKRFAPHDFAGYGSYNVRTTPAHSEMERIDENLQVVESRKVLLKELEATAISGNDILSSTFYVSGLVTLSAGKLAPLCLLLVGVILYLFRGIYHETVMALPCNGGTYNILLNCTSKQVASMAAVFAIIAYITTGVVSALEAIAYLQTVLPVGWEIDAQWATILLLFFFCCLTNLGMQESATFAKVVFVLHVATLSLLTTLGVVHMVCNPGLIWENWDTPYPSVDVAGDMLPGTFWMAVFYGFSSAMLGVSGFETSSQFVEEQAPGVFPKTLRNMWAGVFFFNPLLSLISFSCLRLDEIMEHKDTVLARTAHVVGVWVQNSLHFPDHYQFGPFLSVLVSVDAFVVLAAALLTGYVGINGLIRRMAMDRCLPQFFLRQNPWTGTDSFILVGFFLLCVSQVVALDSDVEALGGVYCFAFLSVMTIFACGNIILKVKRPSLPREISVSWTHSIVGLIGVLIALMGNILGKPELLTYFFVYVLIVGLLVLVMFQRVRIMRLVYKVMKSGESKNDATDDDDDADEMEDILKSPAIVRKMSRGIAGDDEELATKPTGEQDLLLPPPPPASKPSCLSALSTELKKVQDVPFIFYCKHDDLHMLNKAVLYIQVNEQTNKIIIVHCADYNQQNVTSLTEHVKLLDLLYPRVKISLLIVNSQFNAATVEWLSQALNVPINAMFISCPDSNFAMKVSQLRGMRIIASYD